MNKVQDTNAPVETPTAYRPSVAESMAEVAKLMLRCDLPEPGSITFDGEWVNVRLESSVATDVWADAMGLDRPVSQLHEYDYRTPIWSYDKGGRWGALNFLVKVGLVREIPDCAAPPVKDSVDAQPAVAS